MRRRFMRPRILPLPAYAGPQRPGARIGLIRRGIGLLSDSFKVASA